MSTARVMQGEIRVRDPRHLLVERAAVLLRRMFRSVGRGLTQWREQARRNRRAARGAGLGALMGRALTARGARNRMLAVEERLTLGPKQHMYLIRCGEQRLLVASAGEAALQWMELPDPDRQGQTGTCANTLPGETKAAPRARRRTGGAQAGTKRAGRGAASQAGAEGAR